MAFAGVMGLILAAGCEGSLSDPETDAASSEDVVGLDTGVDTPRDAQASSDVTESDSAMADTGPDPEDSGTDVVTPPTEWGASGPLKAVPGAVGGGQDTTGGRGGRILIVNTLEDVTDPDDDLLSLREAMRESGPRHIVFEVGGVFEMDSNLDDIRGGQFTLACQTAPAPGVIIKARTFVMSRIHHVIMQHCRHRNTDENVRDYGRGIGLGQDTDHIYIDHASVSWATDENSQGYAGGTSTLPLRNITLANSIIAEGDADSSHEQSMDQRQPNYHSMGPSCNSNNPSNRPEAYSIVRNFIAHNSNRNGAMYSCEGETVSNIIYNWAGRGTDLGNWGGDANIILRNNLYKAGPSTYNVSVGADGGNCGDNPYRCAIQMRRDSATSAFSLEVGDNYFINAGDDLSTAAVMNDHPNLGESVAQNFDWETPRDVPITEMAAEDSPFLRCVGASMPARDEIDARVIAEFHAGTGAVGIFENERDAARPNTVIQRDYSMYMDSRHPEDYDTDRDGMADAWERMHGFEVGTDDSAGDHDSDGWTNIEEFFADAGRCE